MEAHWRESQKETGGGDERDQCKPFNDRGRKEVYEPGRALLQGRDHYSLIHPPSHQRAEEECEPCHLFFYYPIGHGLGRGYDAYLGYVTGDDAHSPCLGPYPPYPALVHVRNRGRVRPFDEETGNGCAEENEYAEENDYAEEGGTGGRAHIARQRTVGSWPIVYLDGILQNNVRASHNRHPQRPLCFGIRQRRRGLRLHEDCEVQAHHNE